MSRRLRNIEPRNYAIFWPVLSRFWPHVFGLF